MHFFVGRLYKEGDSGLPGRSPERFSAFDSQGDRPDGKGLFSKERFSFPAIAGWQVIASLTSYRWEGAFWNSKQTARDVLCVSLLRGLASVKGTKEF